MKECSRCLFTEEVALIMEDGQCEYCKLHDKLEAQSTEFVPVLKKIKRSGKGKQYDCVIGISGGLDSTTLLYAAISKWGLRPLVIHFDNGFNKPEAEHNIKRICSVVDVDCIRYTNYSYGYHMLNFRLRNFKLPDADIPNDIAMTKLIYETARMYKIKYILNGHDFRTEGSSPKKWSLIDSKYLKAIGESFGEGDRVKNFPFLTIKDQLRYAMLGIKQVRPFHYKDVNRERLERAMRLAVDFKEYGGKHAENLYTEWVGNYYLPTYHNIDKRITYLSAQVRSGKITKLAAKDILSVPIHYPDREGMWSVPNSDSSYMSSREMFPRYDFKKYKAFWWILMKLKVVPYTMYAKYCK